MALAISLELQLPRDSATVPLVRHILQHTLREIGVRQACIEDIELAVTEACANVIEHTTGDDEYAVELSLTGEECVISVIDTGGGFESRLDAGFPGPEAERGRGLLLMQALMDSLSFTTVPADGTVVRLTKALDFEEAAVS